MNMFRDWDQLVFIYILNVRKYLVTEYLKLGELGCKLGSNSSRCSRQINHFRLNFIFVLACMIQYTRTRVVQHRILNILGKKYLIMNSNFCFLTQYRVLRRLFKLNNYFKCKILCQRCVANFNVHVFISLDMAPLFT